MPLVRCPKLSNGPTVGLPAATMCAMSGADESLDAQEAVAAIPGVGRWVEAVAAPGPGGGGGSFLVEPELAEQCIRGLRGVVEHLARTEQMAGEAFFPPPGSDDVSVNVSIQASIMANRAVGFVAAWRNQLITTADALERQLATYRAADEANRARLT